MLQARPGQACNFNKKEALAQVFVREFCKISKNTFSYRTPPVAASVSKTCAFPFFLQKLKLFNETTCASFPSELQYEQYISQAFAHWRF